jgi:polyhydroxyalkanoate synthesis regulator phasin
MGKKESAEAQAERFRKRVEEMINAGELNPTEADEALDKLVRRNSKTT